MLLDSRIDSKKWRQRRKCSGQGGDGGVTAGGGGAPGSTCSRRLGPFLGSSGTAMDDVLSGWRRPAGRLGAGSGTSVRLLPGAAPACRGRRPVRAERVHEASMVVGRRVVKE